LRDNLKKLEEESNMIKQRKEFASQLIQASSLDEVEIREPYEEPKNKRK
jgi:hypothetical protein